MEKAFRSLLDINNNDINDDITDSKNSRLAMTNNLYGPNFLRRNNFARNDIKILDLQNRVEESIKSDKNELRPEYFN